MKYSPFKLNRHPGSPLRLVEEGPNPSPGEKRVVDGEEHVWDEESETWLSIEQFQKGGVKSPNVGREYRFRGL